MTNSKFAGMEYNEMKKEAAARGIKFIGIKKEDLRAALIAHEASQVEGVNPVVNNPATSVSEKIRQLTAMGMERKDIAKLLGVRYQMVRNVQIRAEEKIA